MPNDEHTTAADTETAERNADEISDASPGKTGDGEGHSWLEPPLSAITRIVLRFPVTTLALAVGLAGICVLYSATHLGYRSSRLALLNPKNDYNKLWIDYIHEFGDEDDAVVVVEGAGHDQVVPVLVELSAALSRQAAVSRDLGRGRSEQDSGEMLTPRCGADQLAADDRRLFEQRGVAGREGLVATAGRQSNPRLGARGASGQCGACRAERGRGDRAVESDRGELAGEVRARQQLSIAATSDAFRDRHDERAGAKVFGG